MIELEQGRWQALLARLYWREPTRVDEACWACEGTGGTRCGIHWESPVPCTPCIPCGGSGTVEVDEMRPRRFAWLLRPFMGFEPLEG